MVVFVARRDKWRSRAKQNLNFLEDLFEKQSKQGIDVTKRRNLSRRYYKKLCQPFTLIFLELLGYTKILSYGNWTVSPNLQRSFIFRFKSNYPQKCCIGCTKLHAEYGRNWIRYLPYGRK